MEISLGLFAINIDGASMMVFFLIKFMKNIVAKKYSGSQSNPDTGLIFSIPTLYHLFNFRLILEYLL